ncbi:MAG: hypothetical protein ACI9ES_002908 [Oceanospirillaceae bacterium]|jgi:hypothetical protein
MIICYDFLIVLKCKYSLPVSVLVYITELKIGFMMSSQNYPVNTLQSYHAHLYFEEKTYETALEILVSIENKFL